MKHMFWISLLLTFTTLSLQAAPLATGEAMPRYSLTDQHGTAYTLSPDTRWVVMSFEMSLSKALHQWLEKDPDFFEDRQVDYVADISPMPAIITKLFAGPKMKRYPFTILLNTDETFKEDYPLKEGSYLLIELDPQQNVKTLHFPKTPGDLHQLIDPAGYNAKYTYDKEYVNESVPR